MKKKKKLLVAGVALLSIVLIGTLNIQNSYAALGGGAGIQDLATPHWDDGINMGINVRDPNIEPPTYITFNKNTEQEKWYSKYGITQIWEQIHMNKFSWYSITEDTPAEQRNDNQDHSLMYENNVERPNLDYWKLVRADKGLWQNLKKGSVDPFNSDVMDYQGDNTGTTTITNTSRLSAYFGQKLEWRYLGYSGDGGGIVVDNPYFPADYPSENWNPLEKDWWREPWKEIDGHPQKVDASPYDVSISENREVFEQKVQWFIRYLFPQHPELRRANMDLWSDAADWATKLTLKNNPDQSTGIAVGWHGSGYYAVFVLKSPPRNNLRVVEFKVSDKKSGKVVGLMTADASNNDNIAKTWAINNQEVAAGEKLIITAKVKNMVQKDFDGRPTRYTPIRMMQMAAFDDDSTILGKWNTAVTEDVIPGVNTNTSTAISKINVGQVVTFDKTKNDTTGEILQWEFTVPSTVKEQFVLGAEVSPGFKLYNDNIYTGDDDGRLRFKIKEEDIGLVESSIELLDNQGNVTNDVVPGMSHGVRITVKKVTGNKLVGDPNDYYNPFAAVSIALNDTGTVYIDHDKVSATKALTFNGNTAVIEIRDAITPLVPSIKADFQIHWFNASPSFGNQSSDPSNDKASKVWRSTNNLSVSNFTIVPTSIIGPSSTLNETLTFEFIASNINPENSDRDVEIEIRDRNGRVVKEEIVTLPANVDYPFSWTVPNVSLSAGSNGTSNAFTVEINPPPRRIIETSTSTTNPYADNIDTSAVMAYMTNSNPETCLVVNNRNTWSETHYIHDREGYRYYWSNKWGSGSYCITTYDNTWTDTRSYYEEYKITNVMFRSKLTKDKLGGDGWVDILARPDQAKVKAGYGFEIKYIVKFDTNTYRNSPKGWPGDCSFRTVSRQYGGTVTAPTTLSVQMPFADKFGNHVTYNLTNPSQSGSWDSLSQVYEMPEKNAFGLKNTREVFTNVSAKDGRYNLKVSTYRYFYGSSYKPNQSIYLCDSVDISIFLIGSYTDDVKSHITQ
ncbi:hypothetical protein MKY92_25245 [Paenibacillus sp. FSL R5-0623]|uniref:hypothetical protein n=1 Tax=Paenibacillus sp. FSL R5-0623 TaxID=2921651 RepID=UPI0030DBA559